MLTSAQKHNNWMDQHITGQTKSRPTGTDSCRCWGSDRDNQSDVRTTGQISNLHADQMQNATPSTATCGIYNGPIIIAKLQLVIEDFEQRYASGPF